MKRRAHFNSEIMDALYHDGDKRLDDMVQDIISVDEAQKMMAEAIRVAQAKQLEKQKRHFPVLRSATVAAVAIIVVLITTPFGRAFAAAIAKTVVQIFNGEVFIQDTKKSKGIELQHVLPYGEYTYSSVEELVMVLGHPLVGLESRDIKTTEVKLSTSEGMDNIITTYNLESGDTIIAIQMIFPDGAKMNATIDKPDGSDVVKDKLYNGADMYITKNEDGVGGTAVWDNMELLISSETLSIQELTQHIDQFRDIK